jgi:outer membrane lipoprotein-sorting protein
MNRILIFTAIISLSLIMLTAGGNAMEESNSTTYSKNKVNTWGIETLMASLSNVGKGSASFREERYISFLSEPLLSKGNLRFQSPDFLFKHTESPKDERLVVFEDEVTITNLKEGIQRSFSLNDSPQLAALLNGIRFTLAGNIEKLNKSYKLVLLGKQEGWQIHLTPKIQTMQRLIRQIIVFGKSVQIFKIEINEPNGDRTVMHIEPIKK